MSDASGSLVADEIARFQGIWRQIRCEADGVVDPADEFGTEPLTTFAGSRYVVRLPDGTVVIEGSFQLDPSQEPKAVDWSDSCGADTGKTFPAIYVFEGDRLIFCAADEGMPRPRAFATRKGETLRVHQRLAELSDLEAAVRELRELVARPDNDFTWSSWLDQTSAVAEIDEHLASTCRGDVPDLAMLLVPTGPAQEVSLSSGWAAEYLEVAARIERALGATLAMKSS